MKKRNIKRWLKLMAAKKQKYSDILLTGNLGYIISYLERIT